MLQVPVALQGIQQLVLFAQNFSQPLWLGAESLQGKTILLHCGQGYGDTIQFCRYAPEPRIGLAWSGNLWHGRDHHRSMTLAAFSEMLPAGMNVVCLQSEVREAGIPATHSDTRIKLPRSRLKTFADTAALVMALDLVISVDTSAAHLAGALGKPVWRLVSHVPDWRWQLDRDDSPWYPGAKIFRQAAIEHWSQPIEDVRGALLERYPAAAK